MANLLSVIEQHPAIWRGSQAKDASNTQRYATSFQALDKAMLGGIPDWGVVRLKALTGTGELSFLKAIFSQRNRHHLTLFVNSPGRILAPWLSSVQLDPACCLLINTDAELAKWAAECALKSGACKTLLLWSDGISAKQARRLQVACEHHHCLLLLFQTLGQSNQPLPIPLDLTLKPSSDGFTVTIDKQQGGWGVNNIPVSFTHTPTNRTLDAIIARYKQSNVEQIGLSG